MNKRIFIIGCFVLLFAFFSAVGETSSAGSLARDLMETSGMNQQILQLPDAVRQGMLLVGEKLSSTEEGAGALVRDTTESIDLKAIRAMCAQKVAAGMTVEQMQSALTWFNSPTGKKIVALETQGSASSDNSKKPSQKAPAPERAKRLQRLMTATRSDESMAQMMQHMQEATRKMGPSPDTAAPANQVLTKQQIQKPLLANMQAACEPLSDAELDEYIGFAESPAGQAYYKVAMETLDRIMVTISEDMIKAFDKHSKSPAP